MNRILEICSVVKNLVKNKINIYLVIDLILQNIYLRQKKNLVEMFKIKGEMKNEKN